MRGITASFPFLGAGGGGLKRGEIGIEKMIEMLSQMVKGEKEGSLLLSFCQPTKRIERGRGNGSEEQRGRE